MTWVRLNVFSVESTKTIDGGELCKVYNSSSMPYYRPRHGCLSGHLGRGPWWCSSRDHGFIKIYLQRSPMKHHLPRNYSSVQYPNRD